MKNSKNFKLSVLVFFAAFLVLTFSFSTGAQDTAIPEIIGKNILYTDKTAIQFAVDASTVDKNDVCLIVTKSNGSRTVIDSFTESQTAVNGVEKPLIFTIEGVPASAICDEITAVIKSGNVESLPLTYSVAEYFYERLYSDGIVNATDDDALASRQKVLYENYISYAESAQELFKNYYGEQNITLVSDYSYIGGFGAVFTNGSDSMLCSESFTTTLTASKALASDKKFTGKWNVTFYGEEITNETINDGSQINVSGKMSVTPVYSNAKGDYFLSDEKGLRLDFSNISYLDYCDINSGQTGSVTVLDETLYIDDGSAENAQIFVEFANTEAAPCTIFEFDFKLTESLSSYPLQIKVSGIIYTIYNEGGLKIDANGTKVPLDIAFNEWGTLRFEYYYSDSTLKVYSNNVFLIDITGEPGTSKQPNIIYLTKYERKTESNSDLYLDNIYIGNIDKAFVEGNPSTLN